MSSETTNQTEKSEGKSSETGREEFECNICFETADQPVVTQCGHLFCWPCLYQWLNSGKEDCPVCKGAVSEDKVIPLYGRSESGSRRRNTANIPQRPRANRTEPPPREQTYYQPDPFGFQQHFNNARQATFTFGGNVGFLPGLFMQWNFGGSNGNGQNTSEQNDQLFVSRLLFTIGILTVVFLLFI